MVLPFFSPAPLDFGIAGPQKAENLAGHKAPPESRPV